MKNTENRLSVPL